MITGKKEELDKIAEEYHCPEHPDKLLTVAWLKGHGHTIRCGAGHYPEEITRDKTPVSQYKQGEIEPVNPEYNLLPTKDLGDNHPLVPAQVTALIRYAQKYGLDAYRGHVQLMYGDPYISIDGYLFYARREELEYTLNSRPLTAEERPQYKVEDGDHAWICTLDIGHGRNVFTGLGIVTQQELTEEAKGKPGQKRYPVVAAKPWQMAQKRAEWQACRRGFPIGEILEREQEGNRAVS